jgi:hypothetical protein
MTTASAAYTVIPTVPDGYPNYEAWDYDCYCAGGTATIRYESDQGGIWRLAGNG